MDGLLALTVLCIIFAFGDFISLKTKSIFSMMFVSSLILLIGFWVGLPKTIFEDSGLKHIGGLLIAFLITHMGTLLSFDDLKQQWKTVVISIGAVASVGIFLFLVGSPLLGREYAVSAAPPISGGVVAAIIMGDAAKAKGLESIAVFATLLVVIQGFFGLPIASLLLNKEARKITSSLEENSLVNKAQLEVAASMEEKKTLIPPLPKNLQTPYMLLAKVGLTALFSFKLSELTNGAINAYVMCLLVGIIAKEIGFLEGDILTKSNSFGLAMVALMAIVFGNLTLATPEMLASLLLPLVGSLTLAVIGIIISSVILGKILNYSKEVSISIGISALFGFPGTFIISNEVANAVGQTNEEKQAILDHILPKMLVAGFMTVTISSVVLAGFMSKLLK